MDDLPILPRRTPIDSMGYLNYPAEILNQIYRMVLVDKRQILCFLCSTDPAFQAIVLKHAVDWPPGLHIGVLDWTHLFDERYFVTSSGLSTQFLRVCKKIWREGSSVLYGNLKIAMRWTPTLDPCLDSFFKHNIQYVLAWADVVYPSSCELWPTLSKSWKPFDLLHWGFAHPTESWETDRSTLRRMREQRLSETGRRGQRARIRSANF
ncbi:hypothetical protein Z517_10518 [Fonsecaea pedrosoi CBS 271.37]|uniref:Uncharacterized protein n=1 Tax=Fonsecaea pedrosoi CBS 271.37 TaxID=1442368 RepID=A0A0D2GAA5_9EURO|nr:uncharacterized protein Z517_10518 [Fonsecaea pedrosoi CBS 271.37]KIW75775.1 hypothetical protein Z517_10518 [Fonsecaea pedrosoi CBS 271.37]